MILVTVGMQLGFDRLIRAMDAIQPSIGIEFIAQTGHGRYLPRNMAARKSIPPQEFEELAARAALIVSHAGIGTILTAQRLHKPIALLPRRASLGEHRNDHQLATAKQLRDRRGIFVAKNESDLPGAISRGLATGAVEHGKSPTLALLKQAIRGFIEGDELR